MMATPQPMGEIPTGADPQLAEVQAQIKSLRTRIERAGMKPATLDKKLSKMEGSDWLNIQIIARDESLDLSQIKICEFDKSLSDVTLTAKVKHVMPLICFTRDDGTEGTNRKFIVKDETGETMIVIWDPPKDFKLPTTGEVLKITHGYIRENRRTNGTSVLEFHANGETSQIITVDDALQEVNVNSSFVTIQEIVANGDMQDIKVKGTVTYISETKHFTDSEMKTVVITDDGVHKIPIQFWNGNIPKTIVTGAILEADYCFTANWDKKKVLRVSSFSSIKLT